MFSALSTLSVLSVVHFSLHVASKATEDKGERQDVSVSLAATEGSEWTLQQGQLISSGRFLPSQTGTRGTRGTKNSTDGFSPRRCGHCVS